MLEGITKESENDTKKKLTAEEGKCAPAAC